MNKSWKYHLEDFIIFVRLTLTIEVENKIWKAFPKNETEQVIGRDHKFNKLACASYSNNIRECLRQLKKA